MTTPNPVPAAVLNAAPPRIVHVPADTWTLITGTMYEVHSSATMPVEVTDPGGMVMVPAGVDFVRVRMAHGTVDHTETSWAVRVYPLPGCPEVRPGEPYIVQCGSRESARITAVAINERAQRLVGEARDLYGVERAEPVRRIRTVMTGGAELITAWLPVEAIEMFIVESND